MSDFTRVSDALREGAEPSMLCATCPWDRNCVSPPSMTRAQIDKQIADAERKDKESAEKAKFEGKPAGMPIGLLMTTMMFAGRDTTAQVCPVFALRLSSSGGREIADSLRKTMQSWDDQR